MKECTKTEDCCPSQARLSKPSHKNRCKYAGSHKARVHHGCLVTAVSQLDGAEKDHIANNPKEGEPLKKLHEEHTNDHLQLLTWLADRPTGIWRCADPVREVAIVCIKSIYGLHSVSGDLPVEVRFRQCWSSSQTSSSAQTCEILWMPHNRALGTMPKVHAVSPDWGFWVMFTYCFSSLTYWTSSVSSSH